MHCRAVLRIMAELEKAPPDQMVWFLATTVSLCSQQFEVITTQIPAVKAKFLCGEDDVDSWSEKKIWDAVLRNVRIVVSTPQILLDALSHAFVGLGSLSLIVFDEGSYLRNIPSIAWPLVVLRRAQPTTVPRSTPEGGSCRSSTTRPRPWASPFPAY